MSKPDIYQIAARIQQEKNELKITRDALEFFRNPVRALQATRHQYEVNFTKLMDAHWLGLRRHSRISPLVKSTDHNLDGNAFDWDEIQSTYPLLVEIIDANQGHVMPMEFIGNFTEFADSQKVFVTYPWTKLYRFMLMQNASMIQAGIIQVYWKKRVFEYQQQIANLNRQEAEIFKSHSLDRDSLANLMRSIAKDMNKLEREMEPIESQLRKYQMKMEKMVERKLQLQSQIDSIKSQLASLPDTAKNSLIQQATKKRGTKMDLSNFDL